jgi:hypothetical protein
LKIFLVEPATVTRIFLRNLANGQKLLLTSTRGLHIVCTLNIA